MKFHQIFIACLLGATQAFQIVPSSAPRKAFDKQRDNNNNGGQTSTALANTKAEEIARHVSNGKEAAAIAAFAAAMAPLAANAQDVGENDVIGLGVGLVATVVSLALGFAVGYGTLAE